MNAERRAKAELAALNNAHWCDLICRLHGTPGQFAASAWINSGAVPPLYPNLVTTAADGAADQHSEIDRLVAGANDRTIAVKDSFRSLDLGPLGFEPLFDAEWFWRRASSSPERSAGSGANWAQLTTRDDLAAWEAAWRVADGHADAPDGPLFPPTLLDQRGVRVLARRHGDAIVAGAISYRRQHRVGITNFFSHANQPTMTSRNVLP